MSPAIPATESEQLNAVIEDACSKSRYLLNVLHEVQQQLLHVPREAINKVASFLDLPPGQIESVVEFYSFFSTAPQGRYHILFSNCTSCGYRSNGQDLLQMFCDRLQVPSGKTRGDGLVSVDETSCIGMCDHGAALLVNGRPLTGLDAGKIMRIAELIETGTPLSDWPAEWFSIPDNIRRDGQLLGGNFTAGEGLREALVRGIDGSLAEILQSGLRGRGGAGFSTGMKWKFCAEARGKSRFVICNADEGEPGTFKDRILLHSHADAIFEGMTTCAYAIGAEQGLLYLRGEYRYLSPHLEAVLARRREQGLLGSNILGQPGFDFDIGIIIGAGAYICGEESALIESLEGKRGIPRNRPPFPVTHGYLGQPTVINNAETFAAAACISRHGSAWLRSAGTEKSPGSKLLSVSGDCAHPGVYEYPFGVSIKQVLDDCGAGDVQAVQIGGPSGTLIGRPGFRRIIGFEDLSTGGSFMIFGRQRDLLEVISNFARFFAHESCGFCTPCRVGTTLLKNTMNRIATGHATQYDLDEIERIGKLIKRRSHCGLGQTAANPILHGLQRFRKTFEQRLAQGDFEPSFDLDAALEEARQITHRDDAEAHLEQRR